jgi:hypothetical protein
MKGLRHAKKLTHAVGFYDVLIDARLIGGCVKS